MKQREILDSYGKRILHEIRTELCLAMRFMSPALDALGYQMDLSTKSVGTDAEMIRFNPLYLRAAFLEQPRQLRRCYMHMLLHCLFRHPFRQGQFADRELFNLCTDIAAEAMLDSIDVPILQEIPSDFRESWYRKLRGEVQILTAEKLYRWFSENPRDYEAEQRLVLEFSRDDHSFWERLDDREKPDRPQQNPDNGRPREEKDEDWKKRAKTALEMMAGLDPKASDKKGSLAWMLAFDGTSGTDYREFLRRFRTVREEVRIDPDSFDYGYYHYGMELYGNMPLIEENEYRETIGIDQLVIAIDTSGSTRPHLVRQFLRETAAILSAQETFFHHVQVHLIECDDQIQRDMLLGDVQELEKYAAGFEARGGMGTDFRPVFHHVETLRRSGELQNLRGLLYFTDGYGTYPEEPTPYDTAFVFCADEDYRDSEVPAWALKLYVREETLISSKETGVRPLSP